MRALLVLIFWSGVAVAQLSEADAGEAETEFLAPADEPALWEYGIGVGSVHFEHYPASRQFTTITLPFPTFQYRGPILRADDQEGARMYLLKEGGWSLQISGSFFPALKSDDNEARRGMEDIPFRVQLGPQLVYKFAPGWEAKLGIFQSIATDLSHTKASGGQLDFVVRYVFHVGAHEGRVTFNVDGASREFLATYYEVPVGNVTPERTRFEASAGMLGTELSYFHTLRAGRAAFYAGAGVADYSSSANRASPLHKSDRNVTGLVGVTYLLGESAREAVPEAETRGILPRPAPR